MECKMEWYYYLDRDEDFLVQYGPYGTEAEADRAGLAHASELNTNYMVKPQTKGGKGGMPPALSFTIMVLGTILLVLLFG